MLKMKKVLSVALVIVIALSTMVMSTSALADGKKIGFIVKADKTESEIVTGAKITVTVALELDDFSKNLSDAKFALMYDDTVYKPDLSTRTFLGDWDEYCSTASKPSINPNFYKNVILKQSTMTDTEKASYNNCVLQVATANTTGGAHNPTVGYKPTESANGVTVDQFSIVFEVIGDADALAKGNKNIMISDAFSKNAQNAKFPSVNASGTPIADFFDKAEIDLSKANIMANMPAAPTGPVVAKAKSQVKMTATSADTVADEFSFRVISKISDSDWDTYFKNTGDKTATTDYITAVGMVAYKGAGAFDAETAKRVVAGESVADYTAATTDYISKADASADAQFGAIIKANHSTLTNDVTYMGFVKYVDASGNAQTIFYETAGTAALSTNYDTIVSKYLAAFPFAA